MTDIDVKFYAALIAALTSIIIALITYFGSRKTQGEIEELKSQLAERKSESDARRDYEYEARKRLYQECEPLLFQLAEVSEYALFRSKSLARTARRGNLSFPEHWLDGTSYYMVSTIYNLLAPVAVFKLIQRRITFVDLSVEPRIKAQYGLAKAIYVSFTDDFDFAQLEPSIDYAPNTANWNNLRKADPVKYWRQGIPVGRLDVAADSLIFREASGSSRLKSYGEFETEYFTKDSGIQKSFTYIADLFLEFHPATRPVLWRMLIAQAHIYKTLLQADHNGTVSAIPKTERDVFDWRQTASESADAKVLTEPFSASEEYLRMRLGEELWAGS